MVAAASQPAPVPAPDESRFVLHGVPWSTYVTLRDALDDQAALRAR